MVRPILAAALTTALATTLGIGLSAAVALAQSVPPRSIEPEPLPPIGPAPDAPPGTAAPRTPMRAAPTPDAAPPAPPIAPPAAAASGPGVERVFCDQPVTVRLAERDTVPERYREFVGIWSDASWTAQLCAALVVENVTSDGTASLVYVFGTMGSNARGRGGVLRGTGIVRDGELRFQNSDGSQFAFRPLYADLDGRLTTPQGQSYQAVFKKTL